MIRCIIILVLLVNVFSISYSQSEEINPYTIPGSKKELEARKYAIKWISNYEPDFIEISNAILYELNRSRIILINGIHLLNEGKFNEAIDTLTIAKNKLQFLHQPVYLNQAYLFLAIAFYKTNDLKKTQLYLEEIDTKVNFSWSNLMVGDVYYNIGKTNRAIKQYKNVLRNDPKNLDTYQRLYDIYFYGLGSTKKADKYLQEYESLLKDQFEEDLIDYEFEDEINRSLHN